MNSFFVKFLAIVVFGMPGCTTPSSSSMVSSDYQPSKYDTVAIYDAESASFVELELQKFFESLGYQVIGEKEIEEYMSRTLGIRYTSVYEADLYSITILLEDAMTDKTMCTVQAEAEGVRHRLDKIKDAAWSKAAEELRILIKD